ncbi:hypothetical protein POSPLADRAFT_1034168 [Postia placenta MAD-698-R-SB12]|uniref:Extracellular membrane protein CFEM domain-containing protein n=1 Tax=Postia placenta MAD-698-R-SB12 TaxID=670580 RepID=A0A1X6MYY4_9APHY|nr:hypothetical protein POSPLADRAFT_1034168 [Postia placenta MAD-698-R-SB12]OSX61579.1 hypothetical protein POSPLADRAFT_1034168 [Postia placenta MAD-698-R-SB12]
MHFSVPFVAIAMLAVGMVSVSAIPLASPEPQTLPGLCLKEGEYCINSQNLSICCEGLTCEASNGMPTAEFGAHTAHSAQSDTAYFAQSITAYFAQSRSAQHGVRRPPLATDVTRCDLAKRDHAAML